VTHHRFTESNVKAATLEWQRAFHSEAGHAVRSRQAPSPVDPAPWV